MKTYIKYQLSDRELWTAFKNGDRDAYGIIYHQFAKSMYSYGLRLTSNNSLIEDCIHDVFVKIYNNKEKLPEVDNIKSYLFIALRNTFLNAINKNATISGLEEVELTLSSSLTAEDSIIQSEKLEKKRKLMRLIDKELSARQKQAIFLRYIDQLSYNDIANIMDINVQSAKNLIQISLKKIRSSVLNITKVLITTLLPFYII